MVPPKGAREDVANGEKEECDEDSRLLTSSISLPGQARECRHRGATIRFYALSFLGGFRYFLGLVDASVVLSVCSWFGWKIWKAYEDEQDCD